MTTIIYHEIKPGVACPDGIAAAWIAKQKYPDAKLIGCTYGDVPEFNLDDRTIIVDFSFPVNVLNDWASISEVIVIDHHKTAMADLSGFSGAIFDMEESGATLAWKTFFPNRPMPAWLGYVRDRDLWNFELQGSEEIHEAVAFMGRSLRQIDFYCSLSEQELQELLIPIGAKLLQPKRKRVQEVAKLAKFARLDSHEVMAVEVDPEDARLISDICAAIYRQFPKYFVVAYTWNKSEECWDLSFRSDKKALDFDVSAVARSLGGGGHRNAAGAKIKTLELNLGEVMAINLDLAASKLTWEPLKDHDHFLCDDKGTAIDRLAAHLGGRRAGAIPYEAWGGFDSGNHAFDAIVVGDQIAYVSTELNRELEQ